MPCPSKEAINCKNPKRKWQVLTFMAHLAGSETHVVSISRWICHSSHASYTYRHKMYWRYAAFRQLLVFKSRSSALMSYLALIATSKIFLSTHTEVLKQLVQCYAFAESAASLFLRVFHRNTLAANAPLWQIFLHCGSSSFCYILFYTSKTVDKEPFITFW